MCFPQAARTVLHSSEPVNQMAADLVEIDIQSIVKQTLWTSTLDIKKEYQIICSCEFELNQIICLSSKFYSGRREDDHGQPNM